MKHCPHRRGGVPSTYYLTKTAFGFHAACRTLDDALLPLIQRRRDEPTPHDLLSHVLAAAQIEGVALTDAQVRDHVMAFSVAGHEPLAAALTWTWIVLATQPDLTEPLRHATDDTPPTRLTQTLSEVLRRTPVYWDAPRASATHDRNVDHLAGGDTETYCSNNDWL